MVDDVSHSDRLRWEKFHDMPLMEFLNTISFDRLKKTEREDRLKEALRNAERNKTPLTYLSAQLSEIIIGM